MDVVHVIKDHYPFRNVKKIDESTIETEEGRKKIYYWSDPKLLDWHIAWRESCYFLPYILTNRMIRTKEQKTEVQWKNGWITIHDEVATRADLLGKEKALAILLEKMLRFGMKNDTYFSLARKRHIPNFEGADNLILKTKYEPNEKQILLSCLQESKKRLKIAHTYLKSAKRTVLLDPFHSLEQGRDVFGTLFWEGTKRYPEIGLRPLANFLAEYYSRYGESSTIRLLDEMNALFPFRETFGEMLIGEVLFPWEMDEFLTNLKKEDGKENYKRLTDVWEKKRRLLAVVKNWYTIQRKKVAT